MTKLGRILIAGGGIAGLTAAAALNQRGFAPELVERSPVWQALGAGISIQPNAMRVLRALGIAAAVEQAGALHRRFAFRTQHGETLCTVDLAALWGDADPGVGIERAKLQEVLLRAVDGVPCRLGTWITSLHETRHHVSVALSDGTAGHYDLVIGADGIASGLRELALGGIRPAYCGQMAWRSLAPICPVAPDEIQFWLGNGCFFGLCALGGERCYGFGNVAGPWHHDPEDGRLARLRDRFAAFGAPVRDYLASLDNASQIHCSAIEWLELDCWHSGRCVLIGDAAHASSPMMGQGGCLAIEDGFVLAELLSSSETVATALDAYIRRRRPRVDWVQQQSRAVGEGLYLPPLVRDSVLRERGAEMFCERYRPLVAPP
jgi:2-polyprenyl-6-methoxyphenol hydroxylase-like FAD-dependent oxidoreductase